MLPDGTDRRRLVSERLAIKAEAGSARAPRPMTSRRKLSIRRAALSRWLHIYVSMFGLAAVLFFGVAGITLNHADW